jgi:5-methylcytosine-specific restriction endonuclease McrA
MMPANWARGGDGPGFAGKPPLCVYCNTPWTEDMVHVYDIDASHGEGSYDFGPEDERATVDIVCSTCGNLIYRKEFRGR